MNIPLLVVLMLYLLSGAGVVALIIYLIWKPYQLRQHGLPAEATILRMDRTLMQINRSHVYEFLLEVKRPGHPAYQVRHRSTAHWNAFVVEPGVRFKVKIDPKDPQRLVVLEPVIPQKPPRLHGLVVDAERPSDPVKALKDLQAMLDQGLVTPEEHTRKKAEILSRL